MSLLSFSSLSFRHPSTVELFGTATFALSTFWVKGLEYTIPTFAPLLLLMLLVYAIDRPR
jgi:hypothetical protein